MCIVKLTLQTRKCSCGCIRLCYKTLWCEVVNSNNTFYRISFTQNSCSGLSEQTTMVSAGEIKSWSNWITTKGNKSLVGMGRGANMRGVSWSNRSYEGAKNNIYRNLALYDVNPHLIEGGDGLEVSGSGGKEVENMWFDHISYKWISDGMDLEYVKGITVSYLDYDGSNEYNCYYYDPYMHLVETAQLTFANVYWHNSFGRVPKVTSEADGSYASMVHIYNSYVDLSALSKTDRGEKKHEPQHLRIGGIIGFEASQYETSDDGPGWYATDEIYFETVE